MSGLPLGESPRGPPRDSIYLPFGENHAGLFPSGQLSTPTPLPESSSALSFTQGDDGAVPSYLARSSTSQKSQENNRKLSESATASGIALQRDDVSVPGRVFSKSQSTTTGTINGQENFPAESSSIRNASERDLAQSVSSVGALNAQPNGRRRTISVSSVGVTLSPRVFTPLNGQEMPDSTVLTGIDPDITTTSRATVPARHLVDNLNRKLAPNAQSSAALDQNRPSRASDDLGFIPGVTATRMPQPNTSSLSADESAPSQVLEVAAVAQSLGGPSLTANMATLAANLGLGPPPPMTAFVANDGETYVLIEVTPQIPEETQVVRPLAIVVPLSRLPSEKAIDYMVSTTAIAYKGTRGDGGKVHQLAQFIIGSRLELSKNVQRLNWTPHGTNSARKVTRGTFRGLVETLKKGVSERVTLQEDTYVDPGPSSQRSAAGLRSILKRPTSGDITGAENNTGVAAEPNSQAGSDGQVNDASHKITADQGAGLSTNNNLSEFAESDEVAVKVQATITIEATSSLQNARIPNHVRPDCECSGGCCEGRCGDCACNPSARKQDVSNDSATAQGDDPTQQCRCDAKDASTTSCYKTCQGPCRAMGNCQNRAAARAAQDQPKESRAKRLKSKFSFCWIKMREDNESAKGDDGGGGDVPYPENLNQGELTVSQMEKAIGPLAVGP